MSVILDKHTAVEREPNPRRGKGPSAFTIFWRSVIGRAYPRVIGIQRELSWLFFDIFLPFMATMSYVLVYEAIGAPESYKGLVLVGGAMTAFWLNVLWSMAMQLYWDKEQGNLQLYMLAPTSRMAILTGMALGGLFSTTLRAAIILAGGSLIFGISYQATSWLALIGVFFLSLIALYGMGMLLSSIFLVYGRGAWQMTAALQEPVFFVSGFHFPVKALGTVVATGASVVPLTLGLDAMRQLLFPEMMQQFQFLSVGTEAAILAGLALFFGLLARWSLQRMERKSRQDGRLTERGN
ncbi:ABC transporter permease [Herpetosiphon sp. NSE202]|uniref:ABC transporter permease n=1 Tax=Herpetosiphon sp. NSE202 TaxID=3351349 RepID=UPI00363C03C7